MPNILLIIGANVGDAICSTPAINLLRQEFPSSRIGLITSSAGATGVFQDNPNVDQIYTAPKIKEIKSIAQNYQIALDLQNSPLSQSYLKRLTIPLFKSPGPKPYHLRDHALVPIYQAFPQCKFKLPENYDFYVRDEHHIAVQKILRGQGATLTNSEILIGVHMGCSKVAHRALKFWKRKIASHRSWPFENFRVLHDMLKKQNPNIRFVFTGTLGEQRLVKKYFKGISDIIDLTNRTSLHELAALMSYCRVFLTGDTGPMHIASCTNVSLVALFGSTKPEVTGPYPSRDNIICLQANTTVDITVEQVRESLVRFL